MIRDLQKQGKIIKRTKMEIYIKSIRNYSNSKHNAITTKT